MQCADLTTAEVCYTDGTGTPRTLIAHYQYGPGAVEGSVILVATRYTEADGTPVDTSGGTVAAGACPVASPDVEWEDLCDLQGDGTVVEFCRRIITTFSAAGVPTNTVADFQADKVTPYVITGTVVHCNQDCDPATAQGVLTTWG